MRNAHGAVAVALVAIAVALGAGSGCTSRKVSRMAEKLAARPPCPPPAMPRTPWRHDRSRLIAAIGVPRHATTDVVAAEGSEIVFGGKFAYGTISKDIEDEEVALWIEDGTCKPTEVARAVTDDDGRVRFTAPARAAGAYQFWLMVGPDSSAVAGTAYVVPKNHAAVLFDIDGTLTTSDAELLEDLAGAGPAAMFTDADAVARHWADSGHLIIYLTGRPYLLHARTRTWLVANKLPPGALITTDYVRQAVPSEAGVGVFKTEVVSRLLGAGLDLVRAYGNAATDVCAYARAGIAPDRTYIVGGDRKRCDDHPPTWPLPSYTEHLRELVSNQLGR